ncbi:MAG: winged helix-turn-helix transcriptional regulator [Candidatus Nealsonbacteria bacterium]|nr:winged helix-turn-helix transcriptional regulator [Candidatus Nealsonbacteria bacterium]
MLETVQLFKALADETRLRILHLLCRRELCVCQIVEVLEIGQSKASRHLAHLRHAGLVSDRREGLWMYYSLTESGGELHQRLVEWLKPAKDEIPMGAADLEALGNLGECGDLCPDHAPSKERERCEEPAAVGS